ncbi:MAG: hypothetical protein GY898_00240 [Proteobacteria bacterium]|nr:hypothetical protein [Pseudomonadota bacterium]
MNQSWPNPSGDEWTDISCGGNHCCAIGHWDYVDCWGGNEYGQSSPPSVQFVEIAAGYAHSFGRTEEGEVLCWGNDDDGEATPPF